ncbi:MAG: DNA-binding protein [Bacteroidetes bacterium]|nr:DNA-binding protein [Bacteroidota bacterium]
MAKDSIEQITALANELRVAIPTPLAAHHLGHRPQTLRVWSCRQNGPISPIKIGNRLLWRVADIKKLLGVK